MQEPNKVGLQPQLDAAQDVKGHFDKLAEPGKFAKDMALKVDQYVSRAFLGEFIEPAGQTLSNDTWDAILLVLAERYRITVEELTPETIDASTLNVRIQELVKVRLETRKATLQLERYLSTYLRTTSITPENAAFQLKEAAKAGLSKKDFELAISSALQQEASQSRPTDPAKKRIDQALTLAYTP